MDMRKIIHQNQSSSQSKTCTSLADPESASISLDMQFRRLMIGRNCSAVCLNKGGHRDALSNKQCEAPRVSRGLLSRLHSFERSERWGLFFVVHVDSLVVDSTFKQSENIVIAVVSSSRPALRGVVHNNRFQVHLFVHAYCTNGWHTS